MTETLTGRQASDAVTDLGWRYLLGMLRTCVGVGSPPQAAEAVARAVAAAGSDAGEHLSIEVRQHRVALTLQTSAIAAVTARDVELARLISVNLAELGLRTDADVGGDTARSVQALEIAIDALDVPAVRPFWKAVMGYEDEPGASGPTDPISDPFGQGWDLFGTASAAIDYSLISQNGTWYAQVGLVVLGHVAALVLAHDRALAMYGQASLAVRSQYWMLGIMVGFTTLALWLLAQAGA
jgi:pterin-4a-carbinolamine dehydratase